MSRNRNYLVLAVIFIASLLAYWPGRTGGFVFDDYPNIVDNRDVQITSLSPRSLFDAALSAPMDGSGRPLSMLSFGVNHALAGLVPLPYKLTNLAIHLFAALIAFFLARQVFASMRDTGGNGPSLERADSYALMVAAIYALHPMQLTSVLYIVQRMTSMAGAFTLLGLLGYVVARRRLWRGDGGLPALIAIPLLCTVLGVMAKENGILLPMIALTVEAAIFRFRSASGALDRRVVAWHLAFVLAPIVLGLAWITLDPQRFLGAYAVRDFTLWERLLTEGRVLVFYIKNLVAPSIAELGLYHDDIAISRGLLDPASTLPALLFLATLPVVAWRARERMPLVTLGILWFFAGHLMESTILPLEIAHEHRNYVPMFGFALVVVGLIIRLERFQLPRWLPNAALVIFVAMLGAVTWMRSTQWSNQADYVESEVMHHPNSSRANYSAGQLYGILVSHGRKEWKDRAYEHLERSAELDETSTMPLVTAVIVATRTNEPVKPEWVEQLQDRYRQSPLSPASVSALKWLVRCVRDNKCLNDSQIVPILEAASSNHSLGNQAKLSADISTIYGEYLINVRSDVVNAEYRFRQSVSAAPGLGQYRVNLINLLLASGRPDDAARELEALRALRRSAVSERRLALLEGDLANLRAHLAAN